MSTIAIHLQQIRQRIERACRAAGRDPASVSLLAVSKMQPASAVAQAVAAGQRSFGENYVQEGVDKVAALRSLGQSGLVWHCIGPLQSNKTRLVAEAFDWVHTIDRLKVAERLSAQRPEALPPLQVCVQVNVDGGANKSGVAPAELPALAHAVARLPRLRLRGLMAIPEPAPDEARARAVFGRVQALYSALRAEGLPLDTLSMGMSDDLEAAIASGSTLVRVGSAIFGARPHPAR
jgi:pyridoxal phosphate enzyme (YggS family)